MIQDERTKYLFKNTTLMAISNLATRLITFLLVPLYTYCLTTIEYGTIDLFFTIATVMIPVFTLNIVESVYRFSMDKDVNKNSVISIACLMFFVSVVASLIVIPVFDFFAEYSKYKYIFYWYMVSSTAFQIFSVNLKGQEKLKEFAICNILNTFLIAFLNIVFLKFLNMKIEGYFFAYIISNFIAMIYGVWNGNVIKCLKEFNFDKKLFIDMIKYSIVLIPTSFLWWIIKASDRFVLVAFYGVAINGIYAISYKIPTILQAIAKIFNQAWVFTAIKEKDSEDNELFTNIIFRKLYLITFMIALFLLIILKPLLSIYVSDDFFEAWKYVPFLLFGTIFVTLGTFLSSSYNVYKDSKGFLFSGIFGAVLNIILNIILIPKMQVYGAAIATGMSYITVFIYRLIDTQKYIKIKYSNDYIAPILGVILSSIVLYFEGVWPYCVQLGIIMVIFWLYKKDWIELLRKMYNMKKGEKK